LPSARERTKVALDAAREEGRIGGRRPKLSDQQQAEISPDDHTNGYKTAADAAPFVQGSNTPNNVHGSTPLDSGSDTRLGICAFSCV
jgi:hypothetical protein